MSDIPYQPLTDYTTGIAARLARLRGQIAAWFWVEGLGRVLWLMLAICAADLVLDWFFRMDRPQRAVILVLMIGAIGWATHRWLMRPLSLATTDDALALQIEKANPQLGQRLISALQLAQVADVQARGMSPILVRQAVLSGVQVAQELSFSNILDSRRFHRNLVWLITAATVFACLALAAVAAPPLRIWVNRNLLLGSATWPQKTYLTIERVSKDGTVTFPRGEDWTQVVSVRDDSQVIPEAVYLDFRRARGRAPMAMKKMSDRQFESTFVGVIEPFEFRARGGDAVTDWVRIELVEQPAVSDLKMIVTPPRYTGNQPEELAPGRGPYYVLKGSRLSIGATANKPLNRAELVIDSRRSPLNLTDSLHFSGDVTEANLVAGQYVIDLEDTLGLTSRRPMTFGLRTRVDREPRVRVRLIGVSGMVVPQARIPFTCRITDDFGTTAASVRYRWKGDDAAQPDGEGSLTFEQLQPQFEQAKVGQPSSLTDLSFEDAMELTPLKIPPGSGLSFRFEALDNDDVSGPNIGRSSEFLVRIVTEEELRTDLLRREKEQRQEFERLLKNQEDLVTDSRALEAAVKNQPALTTEQKDLLIGYHKRQKQTGQNTAAIAERMAMIVVEVQNNRLEEAGGRLQTRLTKEIVEPMQAVADELIPQALAALDKTRRQTDAPDERRAALAEAIKLQTEAAARMKEILEHMVKAEGFQEAVNLLYEIQKAQTEVNDQTNKARQQRIKRILEGTPP